MTMAAKLQMHGEMETGNRVRERMVQYIKDAYPDAVLKWYSGMGYDIKYIFVPHPGDEYPYTCIVNAYGGFSILTE